MILFHDDMGTQISTFFSPQIYKELFLPQYKKVTKAAHDMGMYICIHSCGCIGSLMPLIIEPDLTHGRDRIPPMTKRLLWINTEKTLPSVRYL